MSQNEEELDGSKEILNRRKEMQKGGEAERAEEELGKWKVVVANARWVQGIRTRISLDFA